MLQICCQSLYFQTSQMARMVVSSLNIAVIILKWTVWQPYLFGGLYKSLNVWMTHPEYLNDNVYHTHFMHTNAGYFNFAAAFLFTFIAHGQRHWWEITLTHHKYKLKASLSPHPLWIRTWSMTSQGEHAWIVVCVLVSCLKWHVSLVQ